MRYVLPFLAAAWALVDAAVLIAITVALVLQ
jgi:hypothetical protein